MGKKITRTFFLDDPVKYLFMFVETQVDLEKYELGISFPKKQILDNGQSFREADIPPNAALYVDKL